MQDLLDTHYQLGDTKHWLKSENWLKYKNKEKIEKQNFDIWSAKLKNTYYWSNGAPNSVGDELYKLIKTFGNTDHFKLGLMQQRCVSREGSV